MLLLREWIVHQVCVLVIKQSLACSCLLFLALPRYENPLPDADTLELDPPASRTINKISLYYLQVIQLVMFHYNRNGLRQLGD